MMRERRGVETEEVLGVLESVVLAEVLKSQKIIERSRGDLQ